MRLYLMIALASCAVLAACGSGNGCNAAIDKTFTYGTESAAETSQLTAMDDQLSVALTLESDISLAGHFISFELGWVITELFNSTWFGLEDYSLYRFFLSSQLGCIDITSTSIKFYGCRYKVTFPPIPGQTIEDSIDGSFSVSDDKQKLHWDITTNENRVFTSTQSPRSDSFHFHYSGGLTVTDTTMKGNMLAESSYQGSDPEWALSEALILDLTYQENPLCITGGTLEAKRVWTDRGGKTTTERPDTAVKIKWTSCGQGTTQFSL